MPPLGGPELDFPPVAGHLGYAAIVDGDGLRVV
jgi:hypothetical protein